MTSEWNVREFLEKCRLSPLELLKVQRLGAAAAALLGKRKGKRYVKQPYSGGARRESFFCVSSDTELKIFPLDQPDILEARLGEERAILKETYQRELPAG